MANTDRRRTSRARVSSSCSSRRASRARGHPGSDDRQPAGVQLFRLHRILGQRRRWPAEMAGPRRIRAHRQPDLDQRPAHPQVRRQDVSPEHSVHRRAKPQRRVRLYRRHDPASDVRLPAPACRLPITCSAIPQMPRGRIRRRGGADPGRTGMASFRTTTG